MALAQRMAFFEGGFRYLGRDYRFADVRHVDWWQQNERVDRRDGTTATRYRARLGVTLVSGKTLKITTDPKLGRISVTERKDVHDVLCDAAEKVLARSFDARMDHYEKAFTEKGYIGYGAYQITQRGDLFARHMFAMNLNDEATRCLLYPFKLVCFRSSRSWWRKALLRLLRNEETLDLTRDRDCFLYFLRRHVGLYWPKENLRLYRGMPADATETKTSPTPPPPPHAPREQASPSGKASGGARYTYGASTSSSRQTPPPPPPPPPPKPRLGVEHYLGVLKLDSRAEWSEVKSGYRKLAKQYHPDLMRGRGASPRDIAAAEDMLKGINEAYGWLEDYYRMKP